MVEISPKQSRDELSGSAGWYPYYAGFSSRFATAVLEAARLPRGARVLDIWNGAGTTTSAATLLGFEATGVDLNPAMAVAARARLLSSREEPSIIPLMTEICAQARIVLVDISRTDPLLLWFAPQSCVALRSIEGAIHRILVNSDGTHIGTVKEQVAQLSTIAAFFYVAIFRTVRTLMARFIPSNPTWTKKPQSARNRLKPSFEVVTRIFTGHVSEMAESLLRDSTCATPLAAEAHLLVANSTALPVPSETFDFVLTSPPYCTRIDYAVATMPELAVLGFAANSDFQRLRKALIGNATVPETVQQPAEEWGPECVDFLQAVERHPSKASRGYYYKSHVQYFSGLHNSLRELSRVLSLGAQCALVVQDSYYKDVRNDVPLIVEQMLTGLGLQTVTKTEFPARQNMANIHPHSRRYRDRTNSTESVIVMRKERNHGC